MNKKLYAEAKRSYTKQLNGTITSNQETNINISLLTMQDKRYNLYVTPQINITGAHLSHTTNCSDFLRGITSEHTFGQSPPSQHLVSTQYKLQLPTQLKLASHQDGETEKL